MALFDPATGAWFPDVSQAMLGRERQSQATLGQIGQREDVNRQQKLQDDELKRKNKVIRGIGKQLAGAGMLTNPQTGMPLSVTEMEMESTDAIAGHIAGSEAIWKRDAQMEQQQTSDLNQAAQTAKNELLEEARKRDANFRQTIGTFARDYAAPLQIPPAVNVQGKAGEVSSAINRINKKLTNPPAGSVTPEDEAHLLQSRDRLQRHQENISKLTTAGSAPALVALGQRQMTEGEKSSPEFINQVNEMLGLRLETRAGGARTDDLSESIKLMSGKGRAAAALQSDAPILGDIIKGNLPLDAVNFGNLLTPPAASTMRPQETWRQEEVKDKDGNAVGIMNISNLTGKKTISPYPTATSATPRAKVLDAKAPYSNKTDEVQAGIYDIQNEINKINASAVPNNSAVAELEAKRDAMKIRLNALTAIEGIPSATVREKWERFMAAYARIMENLMINGSDDQKEDIMNLPIMIKDGGANTADALISEMKTLLD